MITEKFTFGSVSNAKYQGFSSREMQDNLYKWGMKDNSYVIKYTYDQYFQAYQAKQFLLDFFNDPNVNVKVYYKSLM
jgi:hypothetical protein